MLPNGENVGKVSGFDSGDDSKNGIRDDVDGIVDVDIVIEGAEVGDVIRNGENVGNVIGERGDDSKNDGLDGSGISI